MSRIGRRRDCWPARGSCRAASAARAVPASRPPRQWQAPRSRAGGACLSSGTQMTQIKPRLEHLGGPATAMVTRQNGLRCDV